MAKNCIFEKVHYRKLKPRQKELFNFQKIAATLADYGFNCIKLADDWLGADFLAYHMNGTTTLKVQLKSRITIARKYCDKDIWVAFPFKGHWYLIKHDRLLTKVEKHTRWLKSSAWKTGHLFHSESINKGLLKSLAEDRLGPVYGHVLAT